MARARIAFGLPRFKVFTHRTTFSKHAFSKSGIVSFVRAYYERKYRLSLLSLHSFGNLEQYESVFQAEQEITEGWTYVKLFWHHSEHISV